MGIEEDITKGFISDDEATIEALFPSLPPMSSDDSQAERLEKIQRYFRRLQMITEQNQTAVISLSVLGVFRRRFKSKVLEEFQEELNLNKIAQNRLGRRELAEVVVGRKEAGLKEEQ